tara:strand:+ start:695 stop:874 length:180 start_codon:yes stop_codon:yes gene_type:complete
MKNNKQIMAAHYYTQGYISLFLIIIILGALIFQIMKATDARDDIIKHKVDVEVEKKLYY